MRTKHILHLMGVMSILLVANLTTSCNKDDGEKFSAEQIKQALLEMQGNYQGTLKASFYQGSQIAKMDNIKATSNDSLTWVMPLEPIASTMVDAKVAEILRSIETVKVKGAYDFYQIDNNGESMHFLLKPQTITIPADGDTPDVTIVFADGYSGDYFRYGNAILFNISPKEIWVRGVKLDSFKQLVYHFEGIYE